MPATSTQLLPPPGRVSSSQQVTETSYIRLLWDAWKAYAARAGAYQSIVLLSVVYFVVLGPSALLARLSGRQLLRLDRAPRASYWIERAPIEPGIDALRRPF